MNEPRTLSPPPSDDRSGTNYADGQCNPRRLAFLTVRQRHHWTLILSVFAMATAAKILLFPAYRSTDFDVHNHWKALTRQLHHSPDEWYFDDTHVRTVHTLDYPPAFAWFEYGWANNYLTTFLLSKYPTPHSHDHGVKGISPDFMGSSTFSLDESCLAFKESSSSSSLPHSVACVAFMRSTVLLSELVYWLACYVWACIILRVPDKSNIHDVVIKDTQKSTTTTTSNSNNKLFSWHCFLLLSLNPAILWLDHVHFQYNGFLLGILLLSLACLWQGAAVASTNTKTNTANDTRNSQQQVWLAFHLYHLAGAILFALLLTLKHLYMTLAPWYFCYLLRKYCFVLVPPKDGRSKETTTKVSCIDKNTDQPDKTPCRYSLVFSLGRFLVLGAIAAFTILLPFVPLVWSAHKHQQHTTIEVLHRILQRLFPFGRGLVHDYWAGNVWALYMALYKLKVLPFLSWLPAPDDIFPPSVVASVLLISLLPGCWCAWNAASCTASIVKHDDDNDDSRKNGDDLPRLSSKSSSAHALILAGVSYSALVSFMTAYHVHEKAIVTTLLPLTLWTFATTTSTRPATALNNEKQQLTVTATKQILSCDPGRLLLFRTQAFGLLGLLPLLFPATEMAMKLVSFAAFMIFLHYYTIFRPETPTSYSPQTTIASSSYFPEWKRGNLMRILFTPQEEVMVVVSTVVTAVVVLELLPISLFGRFEFIPLALTSVVVASGLCLSFVELLCICLCS
ncbi:hypothetical protein ACA910_009112 [Epithemia clementina (nom. ined.)]